MNTETVSNLAGALAANKVNEGVRMVIQESGLPVDDALSAVGYLHRAQAGEISVDDLKKILDYLNGNSNNQSQPVSPAVQQGVEMGNGGMPRMGGGMPGPMGGHGMGAPAPGPGPGMNDFQSFHGDNLDEAEAQRRELEASIQQQMGRSAPRMAPGVGPQQLGRVAGPGAGGAGGVDMNDPRVQAMLQQQIARAGGMRGAPGMVPPMRAPAPPQRNVLDQLSDNLNTVGADLARTLFEGVLDGVDPRTVSLSINLTYEGYIVNAFYLDEATNSWAPLGQYAMPEHSMLGRQLVATFKRIANEIDDPR